MRNHGESNGGGGFNCGSCGPLDSVGLFTYFPIRKGAMTPQEWTTNHWRESQMPHKLLTCNTLRLSVSARRYTLGYSSVVTVTTFSDDTGHHRRAQRLDLNPRLRLRRDSSPRTDQPASRIPTPSRYEAKEHVQTSGSTQTKKQWEARGLLQRRDQCINLSYHSQIISIKAGCWTLPSPVSEAPHSRTASAVTDVTCLSAIHSRCRFPSR